MYLERSTGTLMSRVYYGLSYPEGYILQGDAFVVLDDSILRVVLPLRNILYHKNIPMIIQSLGSTRYLSFL